MPNFTDKIVTVFDAFAYCSRWKTQGKTVVLTNGVFDLLHVGHASFLESARKLGEKLIVGVNSDLAVKDLKGDSRPIVPEADRASLVAALEAVDLVVVVNDTRMCNFLEVVGPSIWCKSGYTIGTLDPREVAIARQHDIAIVLLQTVPGRSTSRVIEQIKSSAEAQRVGA